MPAGRPSDYTSEIAAEICRLMAEEGKSLLQICRLEEMPAKSTVFRWLDAHEEFRDQYAHARLRLADYYFEECADIADGASYDNVQVNRARLRVDTRKWIAARMNRAKYGDHSKVDLGTPDGPVRVSAKVDVPEELREPIAKAMEEYARRKR